MSPFHRRHFQIDFLNGNVWILLKISLAFVLEVLNNNTPALVQMMVWHRPGANSLSEPMMISLLMHICVSRPQWVNVVKCPLHLPAIFASQISPNIFLQCHSVVISDTARKILYRMFWFLNSNISLNRPSNNLDTSVNLYIPFLCDVIFDFVCPLACVELGFVKAEQTFLPKCHYWYRFLSTHVCILHERRFPVCLFLHITTNLKSINVYFVFSFWSNYSFSVHSWLT